jgi:hypothetical protein
MFSRLTSASPAKMKHSRGVVGDDKNNEKGQVFVLSDLFAHICISIRSRLVIPCSFSLTIPFPAIPSLYLDPTIDLDSLDVGIIRETIHSAIFKTHTADILVSSTTEASERHLRETFKDTVLVFNLPSLINSLIHSPIH